MTTNVARTLVASAARTSSSNTSAFNNVVTRGLVAFVLDVTAKSGTTPTLDVTIEFNDMASGKWITIATFTQIGDATGNERITVATMPENTIRAAWVIGGTDTPTYTFSVGMAAQDD